MSANLVYFHGDLVVDLNKVSVFLRLLRALKTIMYGFKKKNSPLSKKIQAEPKVKVGVELSGIIY